MFLCRDLDGPVDRRCNNTDGSVGSADCVARGLGSLRPTLAQIIRENGDQHH